LLTKTELKQVLLLSAIGVMALMSVRSLRAQTSNPCTEVKLPAPVVESIKTKFSGWRPKQISDLAADDQQLWLKAHRDECPGMAVGHFESSDQLSYGVLLVPQSKPTGGYNLLVFNRMANGDVYVWKSLDHAEAAYSGLVISKVPPGQYSHYDNASISAKTKLDSILLEWIEKGAYLYYWSAGRYKKLEVSG